jgi:hypothetical protein
MKKHSLNLTFDNNMLHSLNELRVYLGVTSDGAVFSQSISMMMHLMQIADSNKCISVMNDNNHQVYKIPLASRRK